MHTELALSMAVAYKCSLLQYASWIISCKCAPAAVSISIISLSSSHPFLEAEMAQSCLNGSVSL